MSKLKSLNKKLKRLESSMQKDATKLAKLQRKVETALKAEKAEAARPKSLVPIKANSKPEKPAAPVKKKRMLTPEGRAKLASLMKARWEAKRAAASASSNGGGEHRF